MPSNWSITPLRRIIRPFADKASGIMPITLLPFIRPRDRLRKAPWGYKGYLKNHILPALGDMDLKDITVDTVQNYINGKAPACARKTLKEHITLAAEIMDGRWRTDGSRKIPSGAD